MPCCHTLVRWFLVRDPEAGEIAYSICSDCDHLVDTHGRGAVRHG